MKKGKKVVLTTEVSLARFHSNKGEDGIHITIEDKISGLVVLRAELRGDTQMADLLTSRVAVGEAEVFVGAAKHWGCPQESKTVHISVEDDAWGDSIAEEAAKIAEKENPGWEADQRDWSSHRPNKGKYAVTLRRWVKK